MVGKTEQNEGWGDLRLSMTITTVGVSHPKDIEAIVNKATTEGTNLLLLYDKRVDKMLHGFLREFAQSDERFSILFSGDRIRTIEEFYEEARNSIPLADYMGSNLDALEDVLRVEGISLRSGKDVYWIWEKSHILYESEPESFRSIYEVMAEDSREVRSGFVDSIGNTEAPWTGWTPQRVVLILTGRIDVMASEASRPDSFFHRFVERVKQLFGDVSTQTVTYHLK